MPTASCEAEKKFVCKGKPGVAVAINTSSSDSNGTRARVKQHRAYASRCPHVTLIGNIYVEDLKMSAQSEMQRVRKRKKQQHQHEDQDENDDLEETISMAVRRQTNDDEPEDDDDDNKQEETRQLTCDECEQRKNLWLCLRESCMYVGCGESNSSQHSTNHAQVNLTHFLLKIN